MLFLHSAYELNKAVWPVGHLRIVLTVREPNAFTGRLGRLLLVDCEFVEFGYEPFVFIDYVSRCHDSLIVVGPRRLREWCYAFIDFHKIEKAQGWRSDGGIWARPTPAIPAVRRETCRRTWAARSPTWPVSTRPGAHPSAPPRVRSRSAGRRTRPSSRVCRGRRIARAR